MDNLLNLARMVQLAHSETAAPSVKAWARRMGRAYLLAYTILGA